MTTRTSLIVIILLMAASLAASALLYSSLPDRVPTHWNIRGEVDGWSSRSTAVFVLPAISLVFLVFILAGQWLSPVHFKIAPWRETFNYVMVIGTALVAYLHGLALMAALNPHRQYGRWLVAGLLLFLAWLGNLLGKTRRNFWVGIRTPWTLASDTVWIATHRVGARLIVAVCVVGAVAALLGAPLAFCFGLLMAGLFIPVFYSLWLSKKLEKEHPPEE